MCLYQSRALRTRIFTHILLGLPINIKDALYVEGGPEAILYAKIHDKEMALMGTCETDHGNRNEIEKYTIPNVIGMRKRNGVIQAGGD